MAQAHRRKLIAATVLSALALLFYMIAVGTNRWMSIKKLMVSDPNLTELYYRTDTHYGLFRFCISYDQSYASYSDGCHAITSSCQADVGFGKVTVFGRKGLGHCAGFNATRVFAITAMFTATAALVMSLFMLCNLRLWIVGAASALHWITFLSAFLAMGAFSMFMYYTDGGYWVWGLGYQYSFVTLIFGWLFSIVAAILTLLATRGAGKQKIVDPSYEFKSAASSVGHSQPVYDDKAKLALAADGSRVNAGDDSAMDVDDADPYGHRYPSDDAFRRPPNLTDFAHTA